MEEYTIRFADYSRISNVLRKRRMQLDITGCSGYLSHASVYTISLKASVDQTLRILVPSSAKKQKPTDIQSRPNRLA